jgi:hypothetical protein
MRAQLGWVEPMPAVPAGPGIASPRKRLVKGTEATFGVPHLVQKFSIAIFFRGRNSPRYTLAGRDIASTHSGLGQALGGN